MSAADYAKCRPASQADALEAAIPTHLTSNGEYLLPDFQTPEQQQVEQRIIDLTDTASRKLNLSRRRFLVTTGGWPLPSSR